MIRKIILNILFIIPQIWCFGQNTEFEEFNMHYNRWKSQDKELALKSVFKALEIAKELKNDSITAQSYAALSTIYRSLGNLTSALDYALKAEPYYTGIKGQSILYFQIASIYGELNNNELALNYLNRSLKVALSLKDKPFRLIAALYTNIGEIYRDSKKYDSALIFYDKARDADLKEGSSIIQTFIKCNSGLVYEAIGETEKSDSLIQIAFVELKNNKNYGDIAEIYRELSKINFNKMQYDVAVKYAQLANEIADENDIVIELRETSLLLSEINSKNGNFENAYKYLVAYNKYNKNIAGDSAVSKIAEMRAEFEISQNEAELTYHKNLSTARTRLLFVALAGLAIISFLAAYAARQSRRRKEANLQLSEFNEELTQKNEVISQQSRDKDMLMKEIHHRVKNNLQIISSIMNLQSMRIENKLTLEIFEEMQRRIMAISGIHQKLYQSESVSVINVKDYLSEIVEAIHSAFNNGELNVNYQIAVENIELSVDVAVALGLIVNELTTNAYKYAFAPEKENNLILTLKRDATKHLWVSLEDNGPGVPDDFDFVNANSLGLRMVYLLTQQQNGTVNIDNKNGTRFEIIFEGPF